MTDELVNIRYMVNDVQDSVDFYSRHFGFQLRTSAAPAFADVIRGRLRLLLAGPESSAARKMPDGRKPEPGGWNRLHLVVEDIEREVQRLHDAGCTSEIRSSLGLAAARSCSTTHPAIRSNSSSQP